MLLYGAITLLFILGGFLLFRINPFTPLKKLRHWKPPQKEQKLSPKQFVQMLEGKKKENFVKRSLNDSKKSLQAIGEERRYKHTVRVSAAIGMTTAFIVFLLFRSPILMLVIGGGAALIPLWLTQMSVYRFTKNVNDQLETALSAITTSYIRHADIVAAIKDSLLYMNSPVKEVFQKFITRVVGIDPNIERAIALMKEDLDNLLFHEWCDMLLLCQDDHTMIVGLQPIVNKLSELKSQQEENETQMLVPLKDIIMMVGIACSAVPILYFMQPEWYYYAAHTFAGQCSILFLALASFSGIHKAIKLSRPVEYKL